MKKNIQKALLIISIIVICISFVACDSTSVRRNVERIAFKNSRDIEGIAFDIDSKKVEYLAPNIHLNFKSNLKFDDLLNNMKNVSPQYEYEVVEEGNKALIFNNSKTSPSIYVIWKYEGNTEYDYLLTNSNLTDIGQFGCIYKDNKNYYVTDVSIDKIIDYYEKNNYTINKNGEKFNVIDNLGMAKNITIEIKCYDDKINIIELY